MMDYAGGRIRGLMGSPLAMGQEKQGAKQCPAGYQDVTEPGVGYKRCKPMSANDARNERLGQIPKVGGQMAPQLAAAWGPWGSAMGQPPWGAAGK
jgi:hypothetical protein